MRQTVNVLRIASETESLASYSAKLSSYKGKSVTATTERESDQWMVWTEHSHHVQSCAGPLLVHITQQNNCLTTPKWW